MPFSAEIPRERGRSVRIAAGLIFWRISLPVLGRTFKLERLVGAMASPEPRAREPGIERFATRVAARLWRRSDGPCLGRSLALYRMLGRAGAVPMLLCGMAQGERGLIGHAWVEVDGRALIDATNPADRYTVVTRYSADGSRVTRAATPDA